MTLGTEPATSTRGGSPSSAGRRTLMRRALRGGWVVLLLAALALALRSRWAEVSGDLASLDVGWLVVAGAAALLGVGLSAGIWHAMLVGIGEPLPVRASLRIFFVGQIGKYVPGAVWPAVTQAALARDHHVAPRATVSAVTLFLWIHLVTGATVGVGLLALTGGLPRWTLLALPVLVALLAPPVLRTALQWLLRIARRAPLRGLPDARHLTGACAWALAMWVAYALHLWALTVAVGQPVDLARAGGAFAAAWVVGFVLLVAPAGVGPREAAMVGFLPLAAGTGLLAALASRLLMTAADGCWAAVAGVRPVRDAAPAQRRQVGGSAVADMEESPQR